MTALDSHLSDVQLALLEDTAALARDVLAPLSAPGRVNRPLLRAMAEHGLLARLFVLRLSPLFVAAAAHEAQARLLCRFNRGAGGLQLRLKVRAVEQREHFARRHVLPFADAHFAQQTALARADVDNLARALDAARARQQHAALLFR